MLDVRRLKLLWELERRGTVSAVAKALNYSSSAVSQQLTLLERELGTPLFTRSGRRLELSAAALELVAQTETVLAAIEHAEHAVNGLQSHLTGTLRVASFQTAMLSLIPRAIQKMREQHPEVRVEIMQYEPETGMRETWLRGFDLVIAEQYPGHAPEHFSGLDRKPLLHDRIHLALPAKDNSSAELLRVKQLSDTAELPWVMEPRGAASRHWAEQACRVAGFEPDVRFVTADLQAHLQLVASGNAVSLLPGLVHLGNQTQRVRLRPLPDQPHRTVFTAARVASRANPALRALRQVLAAEAAELATHSDLIA